VGLDQGAIGPVFNVKLLSALQTEQLVLCEEEVEYAKALYDGDILNSDRFVGEFLGLLEDLSLHDRTLVVVTSDHGEELNDHFPSRTGDHGHSLRDSQMMVPLILYDPLHNYAVREVTTQVRLIDVMPTIADLMGVTMVEPTIGSSLVPLMQGTETKDRLALLGQTKGGPPRFGVRGLGFKYIFTARPDQTIPPLFPEPPPQQLYDLNADPGEGRNLAQEKPKLMATMHQHLNESRTSFMEQINPVISGEEHSALRERLKSLGYIN
jgi:arylsulfatase A-like enzyme